MTDVYFDNQFIGTAESIEMSSNKPFYPDELNAVYAAYMASHPEAVPKAEDYADGKLTPMGLRNLHEQLCREKGMDADAIIKQWNKLCPGDEW